MTPACRPLCDGILLGPLGQPTHSGLVNEQVRRRNLSGDVHIVCCAPSSRLWLDKDSHPESLPMPLFHSIYCGRKQLKNLGRVTTMDQESYEVLSSNCLWATKAHACISEALAALCTKIIILAAGRQQMVCAAYQIHQPPRAASAHGILLSSSRRNPQRPLPSIQNLSYKSNAYVRPPSGPQ